MNLFLSLNQPDFTFKQVQTSNSTTDTQSRQEEPFSHWEPLWFQVQNLEKIPDALNICPVCCKLVSLTQEKLACESLSGRIYLAHPACAADVFQFTEYGYSAKKIQNRQLFLNQTHKIGCNQYLIQLSIEHPLTPKKFYQNSHKMLEIEKKLKFDPKELATEYFQPNCIVLPLKQFKICIKIIPLFVSQQNHQHRLQFRVDLSKQGEGTQVIEFEKNGIAFIGQFQIIQESKIKRQIVDNMNFKYRRPYLQQNFMRLNKFFVEFKDQEYELNPQIVSNPIKYQFHQDEQMSQEIQIKINCPPPLRQQIPVTQQIQNDDEFLKNIKTQTGSKQFQKKVKNLKHQQIEGIIDQILPHLQEVILNHYANYMFQSLLAACTFEQRMRIILKVADILTRLVCQQQGTFVFQQLIAFLTTSQQYSCICQPSMKDFKIIALDNYGNHFIRKLIQNMPKQMIGGFMPSVYHNFVQFATNKNAVCVMKCVIRALVEGEKLNNQISQHLKKFLDTLILNTQSLINDEFGNYLIQEAYQLVDPVRLTGISQYIVNFFMNCSCGKFSSNVVLNCIKKYWKNNMMAYKTLKQTLENKNISYMYQNKEGNRILLQIMELPMELGVKDKISLVLRNEQASKFNNRRWVSVTGKCKTGAVGTNYTSFSEAISFSKRKPYN